MKRVLPILTLMLCAAVSCSRSGWTAAESELINAPGDIMRVLVVDDPADSLVLHQKSIDLDSLALNSAEYEQLARKMLATVTSPEQDGVGIAAPQVGILRRMVAVQRFDKPGEPFEVYPNIRIVAFRGEREAGPEGCLSVPGRRGDVLRYRDIDIEYYSPVSKKDTLETIQGFTAVIFQHECDHLDGILWTER